MKIIAHYTFASFLFLAVFFSLVFLNALSFVMLRKLNKEEEVIADHLPVAEYELCYA